MYPRATEFTVVCILKLISLEKYSLCYVEVKFK